MMNNIVWLASYPKSGNTWFRIFLSNLMGDHETPGNINKITSTNGIASGRSVFDEYCGIEASDLSYDQIDNIRPEVYRLISKEAKSQLYIKVHDAYTYSKNQQPLFPPDATKGILYIMRNPLDVAVSYANHAGISVAESIRQLGDNTNKLSKSKHKLSTQLRQELLTWSNHVKSWTTASNQNVHIMRYEDMKLKPIETFSKAVDFFGLKYEEEDIVEALNKSRFEELQKQEKVNGFKEKPSRAKLFFRKGQIGSWREHLSNEQVQQIINDHNEVMTQFGYLTLDGKLVY